MGAVFVSHSKHDIHLRKYFSEIFTSIGLKAYFMEFAELNGKYAGAEISRMIRAGILSSHDTSAVFVLLGESLEQPPTNTPEFTHNWVTFEVGAAASCLKPVWVFEEIGKFIRFPIPFVTDYAQYQIDNVDHLKYYGQVFRNRILLNNNLSKPVKEVVECQHSDCNARFRLWSKSQKIFCPVCRRETFGDVAGNVGKLIHLKP